MKKLITILMTAVLAVGSAAIAYADRGYKTATLHDAKIRFNGGAVQTIQCYNIDGYNFVRARDICNELDVAVYAIQNGTAGVMIDPRSKPTSKQESEKLIQKTAKVKVEEGELIYDGSVSDAECFLLNGRYYFKLADFADASAYAQEGAMDLVNIEARVGIVSEPFMPIFYGIKIDWDNADKVIDVTYTEIDLQKMFDDIRSGKVLTMVKEKESETDMGDKEEAEVVSKKFERQVSFASAPEEGEILAKILVDNSEAVYLDDAMTQPNMKNYTVPYSDTKAGMIGQCTWYARGRMLETVGEHIRENPFYGGGVNNWVKKAQSEDCPDVDGVTDPYAIQPRSIVIWDGHAAFVEWIDYDSKGNPVKVYFTEANANHRSTNRVSGVYYPDFDAAVKVWDFDKFIGRGEFIGYVVAQ